jgi:quercetin dioxygenase-like cupin family protein
MRPNGLLSPIAFPSLFRALLLTWIAAVACDAQTVPKSENEKAFRGCLPVSDRTSEIGCWILKTESVGKLPGDPIYWYLYRYPTIARAEGAKRQSGIGTAFEALGQVWLMAIAEDGWRSPTGEYVSRVGPLPLQSGPAYVAQYMEAIMTPGMKTAIHRHPGPEAWYTEGGETCLETPEGKQVRRIGTSVIVPAGQPMKLTVTGTDERRSLVLVLHDSTKPWRTMAPDWTPKGLCR